MNSQYNYPEMMAWLEQKGKLQFGEKFHFREADVVNIQKLICYFLKDEVMAANFNLDLSKGILLSGPVGCGKTTLMTLMRHVAQPNYKFIMKTCRDISFEFIKEGYQTIQKYSHGTNSHSEYRNYCFDDLGVETNLKYYGNECNVMAEIILSRYDIYISKQVITHITSNLSATEIETAYGNRVRSRLREMLNLIAFDDNSMDKRV
ncbi:ABC transporter family protein [Flavobacterium croceum DSM 17960]|jgi:DNA replication protein DnaC|uniref:ABC transporter family protein n=1 Tax=Flavobacterium croceum DSM 17960 TaxID=1121886 RepID=A0A2S4N939_9FLAO|nr:ATP-binding cassette domain-containing protein [Flavobacterium croceum]POS02209.1 ABC transporter family protein [Flavobacterium croceum DSM 17960]